MRGLAWRPADRGMTQDNPYRIPQEPGRWRALLLAALVHALLLGLLWFGVRWQNETPVAVEAEVWDMQVKEAAPKPVPAPPEPEVKPPPPPQPQPKPVPPPVQAPPAPKPDIALEQEKKRKEEQKRAEQEKLAEQKRRADELKRKEEEQRKQAERKRQHEEEQRQAAEKKRQQEEAQRKLAAEKKRQEERALADARAADERHQENLRRLQAQAGGSGEAARAQGPRSADPSYAQRVAARIKSHTTFNVPEGLAGNPAVEYDVQLLPDGSLRGMRKLRSSGVPGFDEAVARAIDRSQPFPPNRDGSVPSSFTVLHRPKDQ